MFYGKASTVELKQMWLKQHLALGVAVFSLIAASPVLGAQDSTKSSRLPVTVVHKSQQPKSDFMSGRQDRLDAAKGDLQIPATAGAQEDDATEAAGLEPDIDPLDLLIPSDPHVATGQDKPEPAVRKTPSKPAGARRAINIAYKNGKLRINRFHTVKFDLPHRECRKFPRIIMTDYKLPRKALYTLADNLAIIQKRLCAANGSIMVTCYQGQATVSMRRSRPDDGCS